MKVAISTTGTNLNAPVGTIFGRCQYFIIVDLDTMKFDVIENPNIELMTKAGIKSGTMIADRGTQVVLTGNIGPNAFNTLSTAGVQVIVGVSGTVKEAIQQLISRQLPSAISETVPEYFSVKGVYLGIEDDEEFI